MFKWVEFCSAVRDEVKRLGWEDLELAGLLGLPVQPPKIVDSIGRPQRGSLLANEHPDPKNYRRVIVIRREIALDNREADYVSYANATIEFLDQNGPFPDENPLFLIFIPTGIQEY